MMDPEQDKQACFERGLIEAIETPPGYVVGPFYCPVRVVAEGTYQVLLEVWRQAGHKTITAAAVGTPVA